MEELKPCPFCGSKKIHMYSDKDPSLHGFIHLCMIDDDAMVKIESRLFPSEEEAIKAWNRRVFAIYDPYGGISGLRWTIGEVDDDK